MTPPAKLRRPVALFALLLAATLIGPLPATATANASAGESRAEQRTARAEERAAQRATRRQESAARRAQRAEQRAARRDAQGPGGAGTSDEPTTLTETGPSPAPHADRGCSLRLSVSSARVIAGETVTLSGTIACPTSAEAASQEIVVYVRGGVATASAAALDTITPEENGTFTMTSPALDADTVFQAREGRHRARAVVRVAPALTFSVVPPSTASAASQAHAHRRTVTSFTGALTPGAPGALVALQVQRGDGWRSVAWAHTAPDGSYAINHAFRTPGTTSLRAIAHSGRGHALAVSEVLSYQAPQPQDPQLTLESSADPVTAGQPITLTGVATGAANAPVKLLARTHGGIFAVVAEATTDATGTYTFTQAPIASTIYRVTDALARSMALFEDVTTAAPTS